MGHLFVYNRHMYILCILVLASFLLILIFRFSHLVYFSLTLISCLLKSFCFLHYLFCNISCGMAFLWNPFYSFFLGKNLFLSNLFSLSGHSVFVEIHFNSSSSWWHSQMYSVF